MRKALSVLFAMVLIGVGFALLSNYASPSPTDMVAIIVSVGVMAFVIIAMTPSGIKTLANQSTHVEVEPPEAIYWNGRLYLPAPEVEVEVPAHPTPDSERNEAWARAHRHECGLHLRQCPGPHLNDPDDEVQYGQNHVEPKTSWPR